MIKRQSISYFCPTETEKRLEARLSSISRSQLAEGRDIQNIAGTADNVRQQQQTYKTKVEEVQRLIEEMRRKLGEAKSKLGSAVRLHSDRTLHAPCSLVAHLTLKK